MTKNIEIVGTYQGERMRFDNPDGSSVVIGSLRLANGSREIAQQAGVDDVAGPVTIKGEATRAELQCQQAYRFLGHFSDYHNRRSGIRERQFHFRTFVPHIPHDAEGLEKYLAAAGRGLGIGPAKARRLVKHYGCDGVLDACRGDSDAITQLLGIDGEHARSFAEKLQSQQATESATLEVDRLLSGGKFPRSLGRKCIREWGNKAAEIICQEPYRLMQFRGVGFKLTDQLYIKLGHDPLAIDRQALCLWYGIASGNDGDTWVQATEAARRLRKTIGSPNVDCRAAIIRAREFGAIDENHYGALASIRSVGADGPLSETGDTLWLAEGKLAAAEEALAAYVLAAMSETDSHHYARYEDVEREEEIVLDHARCARCHRALTAPEVNVLDDTPYGPTCIGYIQGGDRCDVVSLDDWLAAHPVTRRWIEEHKSDWFHTPEFSLWPEVDAIDDLSEHQREQIGIATTGHLGILGGSPGTGKSFAISRMIRAMLADGRIGLGDIAVAAPTGKAAVRVTELLNQAGIDIRARTWHSLLGVGECTEEGGWSFRHNAQNPLPFRVLIGDETSMNDLSLMRSIFAARARDCHVLLVGDVNQLPPVGGGAPLRDLINAGVPYGELTEIQRNSGGIVEACAAIRNGDPWRQFTQEPGTNLVHVESDSLSQMVELIQGCAGLGIDPVWDCQVVVAVNDSGPLCRTAVNEFLQDALNPSLKVDGIKFRKNDKVVCLKNGWYLSSDIGNVGDDVNTNDNGDIYVANGELGRVTDALPTQVTIALDNPRRIVRIPLAAKSSGKNDDDSSGRIGNWDLGYALSVHKSQGAEWPIVFVLLDDSFGARMVCDRAWIYTAISRAKRTCYLWGDFATAQQFCRVRRVDSRKTFLCERIKLGNFEKEFEGL